MNCLRLTSDAVLRVVLVMSTMDTTCTGRLQECCVWCPSGEIFPGSEEMFQVPREDVKRLRERKSDHL